MCRTDVCAVTKGGTVLKCFLFLADNTYLLLVVYNGSWSPKVSVSTKKCTKDGEVKESSRA